MNPILSRNALLRVMTNERLWLFILSMIASIINYAFQVYMGRKMTVDDYGKFNYLVAFITNCYSFYAPFAVIMCRLTSENGRNLHSNRGVYRHISISVGAVSIMMTIFVLIYNVIFGRQEINSVLLISTIICVSLCTVILGVVQGLARFGLFGLFNLLLMVTKLILAIQIKGRVQGAILCILLSELIVFLMVFLLLIRIYHRESYQEIRNDNTPTIRQLTLMYSGTLWAQVLSSLYINNGEILLMKNSFSDSVLGLYSVDAMICRIGMYATTIISTVMLPDIAFYKTKDTNATTRILNKAIMYSLGVSLGYVLILMLIKDDLIKLLYGETYLQAGKMINKMTPFIIGISLLPIINSFYLGINRLKSIISIYVTGVVAAILCTYMLKLSFEHMITIYGIIILLVDLCGYLYGVSYKNLKCLQK